MEKLSSIISDPELIPLAQGNHQSRQEGVCLMEAVAWWVGEEHSDHPQCVDPEVAAMGRNLNDCMLDNYRLRFARIVPDLAGTSTDGLAVQRRQALWEFILDTVLPALDTTNTLQASKADRAVSTKAIDDLAKDLTFETITSKTKQRLAQFAPCITNGFLLGTVSQLYTLQTFIAAAADEANEETLIDLQASYADFYEAWVKDPQSLLEAPETAVEAPEAVEAVVVHPEPVEAVQETTKVLSKELVLS